MKKITMILAAAAMALSANAQTALTGNAFGDNWYLGVGVGGATPTTNHAWIDDTAPNFDVRLGKNLTTVFGLVLDADAYVSSACDNKGEALNYDSKTFIDALNVSLLGTFNLSNLFGGYQGRPRAFEVIGLYGFGWGHGFGYANKSNSITSKVALDFALNLGDDASWQVYVEPALHYGLQNYGFTSADQMKYNLNKSNFQLNIGFNYKFKNSNGTHNYAFEQLRDQAEIDALNAQINAARADVDAANAKLGDKDAEIARLKQALADCENKPVPAPVIETRVANLQPTVVFALGSSVVERSQMANVELIANYMKNHKDAKIKISGYASPEGPADLNQKLSVDRAQAVKDILVKKYKIAASRLESEGLGATDKLFEELEFNRVAIFNDTTK